MEENLSFEIDNSVHAAYINKLKNKLFGLLKEREKRGQWEKYLDTILIELYGFPESMKTINYCTLYYKLSSLHYLKYEYFRKTIFESMNLLDNLER